MLGTNYLKFNNVYIPNAMSFEISYENIENIVDSEVGTTIGTVTRLQRRTFSGSFNCTSTWLAKFRQLCNLSTGTLVYQGESIECRARIDRASLIESSEYLKRTDGLWEVSVTFSEV